MASIFGDLLKSLTRKDDVWAKGIAIPNFSPAEYRRDSFGLAMRYADYGDTNSTYGWEIDHIDPNGPDELWNLQPLNWVMNRRKSDKSPSEVFSLIFGSGRK